MEKQWHVWHTVNERSQASKIIRTESSDDDSERKRESEKERSMKKNEKEYKSKSDFSILLSLKQVYCTVMTHFLLSALLKGTTFFGKLPFMHL